MKKAITALEVNPQTDNPFPEIFHAKMGPGEFRALSDPFGLNAFGVNMEVVAPGASSGLKHWHTKSEEFVYIVSGQLTLHYGNEISVLDAGMCVGFKANEGTGHRLVNESRQPATFLVVGSRVADDEAVYDDDDVKWTVQSDGHWQATHKNGEPYEPS